MTNTISLIQLSDLHLTNPGQLLPAAQCGPAPVVPVDPWQRLYDAVELIRDLRPHALAVTGDILDRANTEPETSLRMVADLFAQLTRDHGISVITIPGNHDAPGSIGEAFNLTSVRSMRTMQRRIKSTVHLVTTSAGILRVIGLDSGGYDQPHGHLDYDQLRWFEQELGREFDGHTVVLLHHPPVPAPVEVMADKQLANTEEFGLAISQNRMQIDLMLTGHFHHSHKTDFLGVPLWCGPAASYNVYGQWHWDTTGWLSVIELAKTKEPRILVLPLPASEFAKYEL